MSGEYINAETVEDYWLQLKAIYQKRATEWKDLTPEQYKAIERSERTDSDNHFNEERLGKDTSVIDLCFYKFLPNREAAYRIEILHKDGTKKEVYFQIGLKEEIE